MLRVDGIERLDYRPSELARHPPGLCCARLDLRNVAVAPRVVVPGIYDYRAVRHIRKEIFWQRRDVFHGDRHDHYLSCSCRLIDRDRTRPRLGGKISESFGAARIRDENLVY